MMGRGVGNVSSKAVSRQQFTLTVVKDKIRMKALRDGPGYMKDDSGRFEPLKATKVGRRNLKPVLIAPFPSS